MRKLVAAWAVVVAGVLSAAEPDPNPPESVEGTWRVVSAKVPGTALPAEKWKDGKVVIAKGKLTWSAAGAEERFTYKLRAANPKWIFVIQPGSILETRYEFNGGRLTLHLPLRWGAKRPDPGTKDEVPSTFVILERVAK